MNFDVASFGFGFCAAYAIAFMALMIVKYAKWVEGQ